LNLAADDVAADYERMMRDVARAAPDAALGGVIVSPMRDSGLELLVSVTRDPIWGPMIAVGLGGVMVELLDDVMVTPLPAGRAEVREMLGRLRGAKLFAGYRGAPPVDLDRLADAIVAIGQAALRFGPDLEVLEINPLLVSAERIEALDALAGWKGEA
jgi:hypothetical protein